MKLDPLAIIAIVLVIAVIALGMFLKAKLESVGLGG
jgi:hypothetical protein